MDNLNKTYKSWFKSRGWKPFKFQEDMLRVYLDGYSGLLNAPTGSGKTYAIWLPVLMEHLMEANTSLKNKKLGLQVIWITPVRALANDIKRAMESVCEDLNLNWKIAVRTGDTSTSERAKQKKNIPQCLITTPESLHLMLASKNYPELFKTLKLLVADEWHELLGTKRGVQIELAFSRIKVINPGVKIWGISATIGNLDQALEVLLGEDLNLVKNIIVKSEVEKKIEVETLMPDEIEKFPWGGHLGISLLPQVLKTIHSGRSVLVFTNTRSQTEIWYQRLLDADPSLAGIMAIHHGSVSDKIRIWVENALHEEKIKVVICTSSLDLGVDFRPVEMVIQIGGPKGVARFIQRAGRSGHQPGASSKIYFVPTHSLELVEAAALRLAVKEIKVESRMPVVRAFDVLIQYLVTLAVSDGFEPSLIKQEVLGTHAYNSMNDDEWFQVITFITSGGVSLKYYDEFHKVVVGEDGLYRVTSRRIAMYHRLSIGTIVSDPMMSVILGKKKRLGAIEENFISRLNPGDVFSFAGKMVEITRIRDMEVTVRNATSKKPIVPQWLGGRMSLSSQLSEIMREKLTEASKGVLLDPELVKLAPLLDVQKERSIIPSHKQLLFEKFKSRDGFHLFVYPFEGRFINEGIAALIGFRIAKFKKLTYSISVNDYGFELLSDQEIPLEEAIQNNLFAIDNLMEDIESGINSSEMARRKFRDIAHIAGLLFKGYPGKEKRVRHLQASSRMFFEVFAEHEPNNVLLRQAYDEVRFELLDEVRMRKALVRINEQELVIKELKKPTPFSFPLMVEMFKAKLSTEKLEERVKRLLKKVE